MTAYRIDEFESDDDEFEEEPESRDLSKEVQNDAVLVTEVVEPKAADTTRRVELPEVNVEGIEFKSKCRSMQEEIEHGMF